MGSRFFALFLIFAILLMYLVSILPKAILSNKAIQIPDCPLADALSPSACAFGAVWQSKEARKIKTKISLYIIEINKVFLKTDATNCVAAPPIKYVKYAVYVL